MDHELSRREFLEVGAAAGLTAIAGPVSRDLTPENQRTLLAVARTLFNHVGARDEPYRGAVDHVEEQCRCDFTVYTGVKTAVERLEWSSLWNYAALSRRARVRLLDAMKESEEFGVLYRELLEGLYGSAHSWQLLCAQ